MRNIRLPQELVKSIYFHIADAFSLKNIKAVHCITTEYELWYKLCYHLELSSAAYEQNTQA